MRFKGDFWKKVPLNNPENLIAETQVRFGIFILSHGIPKGLDLLAGLPFWQGITRGRSPLG